MAKRGQFYILAAVILCIVIFGISVTVNKIDQEVEATDFVELAQNYVLETPELINYAIYGDQAPSALLSKFTEDFVGYARKKNPRLGLVYVYKEEGTTKIKNYLSSEIEYDSDGELGSIIGSQEVTLNEVILDIDGEEFSYTIPTKLKHFGYLDEADLTTATKWVKLNIEGVPYLFDLGKEEQTEFEFIIKGKSRSEETEIVCTTRGRGHGAVSCE